MVDPNKRGTPANFCVDYEAHTALRAMTNRRRYGAFLSALILAERARREERARLGVAVLDGSEDVCKRSEQAHGNKYPPAKPEVLRLLAPQRGLTAIAKSKPKTEQTTNGRLPELSNFGSPPAEPGVYLD